MKKHLLLIAGMGIGFHTLYAQEAYNQDFPDSLVMLTGQVVNVKDSTPVMARIRFTKLPHGDDVGIFTSKQDGSYEAPVINERSYLFEAQADGYYTLRQQVDIQDFNHDHSISKNFRLTPVLVGQILEFENILFEQSESILLQESYPTLDKLVAFLTENANIVIQLEGHTDYRGSDRANRRLSGERVEVIQDYLINKGIDKDRVKTKAFGGTMPLVKEDSEEAARLNRRVEIRVVAE